MRESRESPPPFPRRVSSRAIVAVSVSEIISLLGTITPRTHVRSRDEIRQRRSLVREEARSKIGPIVFSVPATQFHYILDASFSPDVVVQVAARAFSLAVISPFTALRFIGGIQCVIYSRASIREPAYVCYRLCIVGCVRRDYSTRREIVAAVSREPCVVPSNRPDPTLTAHAPSVVLARFFARRS